MTLLQTYRCLYGFNCPTCQTPQPVVAMRLTFRGGFKVGPVNEWTHCTECNTRLRLAPRLGFVETAGLQIATALLLLHLSVFILLWSMQSSLAAFGVWGLMALPLIMLGCAFGSAFIEGKIGPYYRQVVRV